MPRYLNELIAISSITDAAIFHVADYVDGEWRDRRITKANLSALLGFARRLVSVTGYTGGGPTKLDGIASSTYVAGDWICFRHATEGFRMFEFTVAATVESSPSFIRCDDALGTKGWSLIL